METQSTGEGKLQAIAYSELSTGLESASVNPPAFLHTQLSCTICITVEPVRSGYGSVLHRYNEKKNMPTYLMQVMQPKQYP